jgi:hypothetical protein
MSTLKADTVTAATTNGDLSIANQGTGGIAIDGMPHRNLLINGDMAICQRATSTTGTSTGGAYNLADRWKEVIQGGGTVNIAQDTAVPNETFGFSYKWTVNATDSSLAASDYYNVSQMIEGFNAVQLAFGTADAKSVTVSFWAKTSLSITLACVLGNNANNRAYAQDFACTTSWQRFELTFPGDTSGTWVGATNGSGLRVTFSLASGATRDFSTGSWQAENGWASTSQGNFMTNSSATFNITGVQVEVGPTMTDFEQRDYASELAKCSRYFFQYNQNAGDHQREHWGATANVSTTQSDVAIQYPVAMRAAPTFSTGSAADWRINGTNCSAIPATVNAIHEAGCRVRFTIASGLVAQEAAFIDAAVTGAKLVFDAEL